MPGLHTINNLNQSHQHIATFKLKDHTPDLVTTETGESGESRGSLTSIFSGLKCWISSVHSTPPTCTDKMSDWDFPKFRP